MSGWIHNAYGTVTISGSTLGGNTTLAGNGCYPYSSGTATLQNSIVANSPSGESCSGTVASNGYNLGSDSTCNFSGAGDLNNVDPKLGQLRNNGGPTKTQAMLVVGVAVCPSVVPSELGVARRRSPAALRRRGVVVKGRAAGWMPDVPDHPAPGRPSSLRQPVVLPEGAAGARAGA